MNSSMHDEVVLKEERSVKYRKKLKNVSYAINPNAITPCILSLNDPLISEIKEIK